MIANITRILVPVDFSAHAERALAYATALAGRLGASLSLLHVVDDPIATGAWSAEIYVASFPDLRDQQIEHASQRLEQLRAAAGADGVTTDAAVIVGNPASAIIDHAREGAFDLIVMATHGRTGLSHLLLGSVAEHVVRRAPCPVLTVRTDSAGVGPAQ